MRRILPEQKKERKARVITLAGRNDLFESYEAAVKFRTEYREKLRVGGVPLEQQGAMPVMFREVD